MAKQIVLVMETRASSGIDYAYIKTAIDVFYGNRCCKIGKVFARSKSGLLDKENQIKAENSILQ